MSDDQKKTALPAESRMQYFKRRSAEAIGLLVEAELKVAATRYLAIDPDGKQEDFIGSATRAWREAVGEIACRSVSSYPFTTPPPPPKLKATANPRETRCNHGLRHCVACGWENGHHVSDYESPTQPTTTCPKCHGASVDSSNCVGDLGKPCNQLDHPILTRAGKTCCYFHATGGLHTAECGGDDASGSERGEPKTQE